IFIILNIILLLFTYSRGAWLCLFIILFLLSFLKYRKKLITSLIILLFLSSSVLFIDNWSQKNYNYSFLYNFSLTRRIAEITNFNPRTSSFLWRIELWKDMADVFWQKPIFGHGIGSFEKEVLKKRGFYAGSYEAHNDYLCIAVELGIIGLASYLSLILIFLKNIIKIYKKTTDKNFKLLYLMFFCLSISLFSVNFSENILRNTIIQWCFWVLAGFIFKSSKLTEK
ncbi:O-antigen ligase family protein, partial [Patescibacteria group bacterium]|nr:O-antigen ligase family protein [Patescibacteria group bacterium]